ncbi:G-protein coupled receptor GRL101-like [Corticium candelabrum]|uniref:G-protein coupled receptor GRL101-like n=1 Tax=Corticium candelabrum TaxID=121492 RepID=UPI002E2584DF|nr:G-protein coupled receptor GRL101-like [Corticium candelabrum]
MSSLSAAEHENEHLERLASLPFHVYLWIVILLTLLGNGVVILWRCGNVQRLSPLSIIVINLAVADTVYGLHLVLIESDLARTVFGSSCDECNYTKSDPVGINVCTAAYFMSCWSSTAQTAALATIAGYLLLSMNVTFSRGTVGKMMFVVVSVVSQWILSFVLALFSAIYNVFWVPWKWTNSRVSQRDIRIYYVLTQCSYSGSLSPSLMALITVQLVLVLIAILCLVVFIVWVTCKYAKRRFPDQEGRQHDESRILMIRLCVVVVINLACWGPSLVLYYFGNKLFNNMQILLQDGYCRIVTEITVSLLSIPPAVNPLIYTIATKQFMRVVMRVWCLRRDDEHRGMTETTTLIDEENRPQT